MPKENWQGWLVVAAATAAAASDALWQLETSKSNENGMTLYLSNFATSRCFVAVYLLALFRQHLLSLISFISSAIALFETDFHSHGRSFRTSNC